EHLRVELVHVHRIFADDDALHLVYDEILDAPTPVRLADAVNPGVRFDLDQVPVPSPLDDHAFDVGDLDFAAHGCGGLFNGGREDRGRSHGGFEEIASVQH